MFACCYPIYTRHAIASTPMYLGFYHVHPREASRHRDTRAGRRSKVPRSSSPFADVPAGDCDRRYTTPPSPPPPPPPSKHRCITIILSQYNAYVAVIYTLVVYNRDITITVCMCVLHTVNVKWNVTSVLCLCYRLYRLLQCHRQLTTGRYDNTGV